VRCTSSRSAVRAPVCRLPSAAGTRLHTLFEAAIRAGASFALDSPTPVFTANAEIDSYDVAPDGQRFLVLRRPPPDFLPFNVIVNWPAMIR
jgi:hypothetical protein